MDFLSKLFDSDFMPHGHCYFWKPGILWLSVVSDSLITLAYSSIPAALIYFVRRRKDLAFNWIFVMFGVFILSCGATHAMEVWTVWNGTYRLSAVIKLITALSSVGTAIVLWPLVPKALALPSPAQLEQVNSELRLQVRERERVEGEIRALNSELETKVQERTEQLRRSNQSLEEFAYVASHDLQEPLRMVGSYVQLLGRRYGDKLGEDGGEYIHYAEDGAKRMQGLINDLLEYSRVGRWETSPESIDAREALAEALHGLEAPVRESGAQITGESLPRVCCRGGELTRVFQNLISNAIKYRGTDTPRVVVTADRQDGDWLISVRDNGIGIEKQHFDKLFKMFGRLHPRDKYPGSGMGLAICKKIVEGQGGRIWVESKPGRGSTFCFTLRGGGTSN